MFLFFENPEKLKKRGLRSTSNQRARRTKKQRRRTRRNVVKQSRTVAKKNRVRRKIKIVTQKEFEEIKVNRKTPQEASKIFAGLAEFHLRRDGLEKAVLAYEEAVQLDSANKDAKHGLSEVYTRIGDIALNAEKYSKAEKDYAAAIKLDPKNSSAYAGRGQVYDEKEDELKAKADYEKAIELDPSLTRVYAPLGIIYYQEGETEKAEQYINNALAGSSENAETQYFLGLIRYKQNRNAEAVIALRKSIGIDADNEDAHYYLGAALYRLGKESEAIGEYEKTIQIDPKYVLAWFDLGVAYYNSGRYKDSISAYNTSIKFNSNQTTELKKVFGLSFQNVAEAYRQTNQFKLAESKYRVAVDHIKDDPELYGKFGFVLGRLKKWSVAIANFEKAVAINPDAISYANLGWAHYQDALNDEEFNYPKERINAKLRKAKPALEMAVQKDSTFAAARLNLGVVLNGLGESAQAARVLEEAVKLRKNWLPVENELGVAYLNNKQYSKAVKQFKKVTKKNKSFVWAFYNMARAEIFRGNKKAARKIQKKISKMDQTLANKLETDFIQAGS